MNTKTVLFFVFLFLVQSLSSQEASLIFTSDEETDVIIYRPIDGFYNEDYPNDTISLKPEIEYTYKVKVDDWGIVKCVFPNMRLDIYVEPDSPLYIIRKENKYTFEGKNAPSNTLYNNDLISHLIFVSRPEIDSIFNKYTAEKSVDIKSIDKGIETDVFPKVYGFIDSLYTRNDIDEKEYNYLKMDVIYTISYKILKNYIELRSQVESPLKDSIESEIESMLEKLPLEGDFINKYISGISYYMAGFGHLYDILDKEKKQNLISITEGQDLGPYKRYLMVSHENMLPILFPAFVLQYKFAVNEFDRVKVFNYLQKRYPQSESVNILRGYITEELNDTTEVETIILDPLSVNSLSDITNIDYFRNKYTFIDLWATWCLPCRQEFLNNKSLKKLLSKYENIGVLYISIDEDEDEDKERWLKDMISLKLSGHHLLASRKLINYIKESIYDSKSILIPRYILLDPEGRIINKDLPRPSEHKELEEALNEILK